MAIPAPDHLQNVTNNYYILLLDHFNKNSKVPPEIELTDSNYYYGEESYSPWLEELILQLDKLKKEYVFVKLIKKPDSTLKFQHSKDPLYCIYTKPVEHTPGRNTYTHTVSPEPEPIIIPGFRCDHL